MDGNTLTPGIVCISGVMPRSSTGYPCLLSPQRWNGWLIPYFDRDAVERIVTDTAALLAEFDPDTVELVEFDGEDVLMVSSPGTAEEYIERMSATVIDGIPHWCVGGMAWTWEDFS